MTPPNDITAADKKAREEDGSEGFSLADQLPERQADSAAQGVAPVPQSEDGAFYDDDNDWGEYAASADQSLALKRVNDINRELPRDRYVISTRAAPTLSDLYKELSDVIGKVTADRVPDLATDRRIQDLVCAIYSPRCAFDPQALKDTGCNSKEEFTRKMLEKLYVGMVSPAELKKQIAAAETDEQASKIWRNFAKHRGLSGWGRARSKRDALEAVDNFAKSFDLAKLSVSLIANSPEEFSKAIRMSMLNYDQQKELAVELMNEDRESASRIIAAAYSMQAYSSNNAAGAFIYSVLNNAQFAITDVVDFFNNVTEDKHAEDMAKIVHQIQGDINGNYGKTKELTLTDGELMQAAEEYNKTVIDKEIAETRKREFETVSRRGKLRTGLSHETQRKIAELEAMKLTTPEQVRELYDKGYDVESKHFAESRARDFLKSKYRPEDALIRFADRSGGLLGYMLPMIAVHAGLEVATRGAATAQLYALDSAIWFPSLYQEAYGMYDENMDTTTRIGARKSQALFAASINSVTQALEVGVFVKGAGGVLRGITGRAAGRASINFSKRGAFTFLKDSVSAETHLFRAKYYDSFVHKISRGLARNSLRWGLDMTVEGLQEGSEELVKALAREAFDAHIKDFEGKDAVDRDAVVQSFWDNFMAAAIDGLPAMILLRGVPAMAHRVRGRTVGDMGIFAVAGASAADLSFMSAARQTNQILFTDLTKTQKKRDFVIDYGNSAHAQRMKMHESPIYKSMSQNEKDMLSTYANTVQWLRIQIARAQKNGNAVRGTPKDLMDSINSYGRERERVLAAVAKSGKKYSEKDINRLIARRLARRTQAIRAELIRAFANEAEKQAKDNVQKSKKEAKKVQESLKKAQEELKKAQAAQEGNRKAHKAKVEAYNSKFKPAFTEHTVKAQEDAIKEMEENLRAEGISEEERKETDAQLNKMRQKLAAARDIAAHVDTDLKHAARIAKLEEEIKKLKESSENKRREQILHEADEENAKRFARRSDNAARMFDEHVEGNENKQRSLSDIASGNADKAQADALADIRRRDLVRRAIKAPLKRMIKAYNNYVSARSTYTKVLADTKKIPALKKRIDDIWDLIKIIDDKTLKDKKREAARRKLKPNEDLYREYHNLKFNDNSIFNEIRSYEKKIKATRKMLRERVYEEEMEARRQETGRRPMEGSEEEMEIWEASDDDEKIDKMAQWLASRVSDIRRVMAAHSLRVSKLLEQLLAKDSQSRGLALVYFKAEDELNEATAKYRDRRDLIENGRAKRELEEAKKVLTRPDTSDVRFGASADVSVGNAKVFERGIAARRAFNEAREALEKTAIGEKYFEELEILSNIEHKYNSILSDTERVLLMFEYQAEVEELKEQKALAEANIKAFMGREKTIFVDGKEKQMNVTYHIPRLYDLNDAARRMQDANDEYNLAFAELDRIRESQRGTLFEDVVGLHANINGQEDVELTTMEWLEPFLKEEIKNYKPITGGLITIPLPHFLRPAGASQHADMRVERQDGEVFVDEWLAEEKHAEEWPQRIAKGPWTESLLDVIVAEAEAHNINVSTKEGMRALKEVIISSKKVLGAHAPEMASKAKEISEHSEIYRKLYDGLVDYAFAFLLKGGIKDQTPELRDNIIHGVVVALDAVWDGRIERSSATVFSMDADNDYVEQALQSILDVGAPKRVGLYSEDDIAQGEEGGYLPETGRRLTGEAEDEENLPVYEREPEETTTQEETNDEESVTPEDTTVEEPKEAEEEETPQGNGYALGRYLASLSMIFAARRRAINMQKAFEKQNKHLSLKRSEWQDANWFKEYMKDAIWGVIAGEYQRRAKELAVNPGNEIETALSLIKDGHRIPIDPFFRSMNQQWQVEKPDAKTARIHAGDMGIVTRLLREFLPGIGVRAVTLDDMSKLIGRDATNVWGFYDADTNEIVIRENAPVSTAIHEMWHAVYRGSAKFAPDLYARMREYIRTAPEEIVNRVREDYKDRGLSEEEVLDEIGAAFFAMEFSGRLADFIKQTNNPKEVKSWWSKLKNMFTRLWKAIVGRQFGKSVVNMRQFKGVSGQEAMSRLINSFLSEQQLAYTDAQATFWDASDVLNSLRMRRRFDEHVEADRTDQPVPDFQGDGITEFFGRILRALFFGEELDFSDPRTQSIMKLVNEETTDLWRKFVANEVYREERQGNKAPEDKVIGDNIFKEYGLATLEDRADPRWFAREVIDMFEKVYFHSMRNNEQAFDDAKHAILFRYRRILPRLALETAEEIKKYIETAENLNAADKEEFLKIADNIERAIHKEVEPKMAKKMRELISNWMEPKGKFAGSRANADRTRGIGLYEKFFSEVSKAMNASDKAAEAVRGGANIESAWSDYNTELEKHRAVLQREPNDAVSDDVQAQAYLMAQAWELFKDKAYSQFTTKDLIDLYSQLKKISTAGRKGLDEAREEYQKRIQESAPMQAAVGEQADVHKSNKRTSKFRQFFRSGYSIEELLDTAVDYAKRGSRAAAHAWVRKLSLELNQAYIRETRFTYNAYTNMFRSAVKHMKPLNWKGPFSGHVLTVERIDEIGSDKIFEDKKARFYVASLIATTLNETRKDSSRFSLKNEKLTVGQLLAQYMMLTQHEIETVCQRIDMAKKKHDAKKAKVELQVVAKRKADPNYQITREEAEALEDFKEIDLYKQWKKKEELAAYLGEDLVGFGKDVSSIFQGFNKAIDKESLRSVGWAMSYNNTGYFPIVRNVSYYMTNKVPTGVLTLVPKTLVPRVLDQKPIDETAEFMAIFGRHVFDVAHFVSYGDVKPLIRAMVQGEEMEEFRKNIASSCGDEHLKQLVQHLTQIYNGYMPEGDAYMENGEIWRNLRTFSRFSAMFFSLPAGAVQMVGSMLAPSTTIGWKAMGQSYIYALTHREEFAHAMHMLLHSDAWKARNKDPNMATLAILSQSSTHGILRNANPKMRLLMHQLMNLGMAPTSYGDRVPSLVNGAAYIAMRIPQLRQGAWLKDKDGVEETPEEREKRIEEQAVLEASKMIDETQQARDPQSKDVYSRSPNSFTRLFIQFRTSPIQYAMKEIRAIERMVAERSFESVRDWICIGGHNHFVAPIMAMLGRALPALIAYAIFGGDDPDKEELEKILNVRGSQIIAGSAESIPIAGWGLSMLSDAAITIASGKAPNYFASKSLIDIPSADIVSRIVYSGVRVGTSVRNTDPDALKKSLDMAGRNFGVYRTLSSLAELFPGSDSK